MAKVNPENPPQSCVEQAVQESHKAGERLKAASKEKWQNTAVVHNLTGDPVTQTLPDLANVAAMEEIEHLLALAESLGDPTSIDLGGKPRM
ncbi:hypothetical protein C0995_007060 [Termitomyces sp. Mi166|nr:hypothetical protein C0995_007060 [Termitomyces sp. Mi166\